MYNLNSTLVQLIGLYQAIPTRWLNNLNSTLVQLIEKRKRTGSINADSFKFYFSSINRHYKFKQNRQRIK